MENKMENKTTISDVDKKISFYKSNFDSNFNSHLINRPLYEATRFL